MKEFILLKDTIMLLKILTGLVLNNIKGHGFQSYPCLLEKENLNKKMLFISTKRNILMEHLQNKEFQLDQRLMLFIC